jgi:hypothetical protein
MNRIIEQIKAFGMINQMLAQDLDRIGAQYGVDLGRGSSTDAGLVEEKYYPQFAAAVRTMKFSTA